MHHDRLVQQGITPVYIGTHIDQITVALIMCIQMLEMLYLRKMSRADQIIHSTADRRLDINCGVMSLARPDVWITRYVRRELRAHCLRWGLVDHRLQSSALPPLGMYTFNFSFGSRNDSSDVSGEINVPHSASFLPSRIKPCFSVYIKFLRLISYSSFRLIKKSVQRHMRMRIAKYI